MKRNKPSYASTDNILGFDVEDVFSQFGVHKQYIDDRHTPNRDRKFQPTLTMPFIPTAFKCHETRPDPELRRHFKNKLS